MPRAERDEPTVRYEVSGRVALITLDRPDRRNALDAVAAAQLLGALARVEADPEVRVVVVTGTDPAFCAGLDLHEFRATGAPPVGVGDALRAVADLRTPTIGAINGAAYTGGLELALGMDLLIASDRAVFADTHARLGLRAGAGMTARLPRRVGVQRALDMSLTGRAVSADEARAMGLVSRVVPHERIVVEALEVAALVAEIDPGLVQDVLLIHARSPELTLADALRLERDVLARHHQIPS